MIELSDDDLRARLRDTEDPSVERKSHADVKKDCLKTAVGFANSRPVGAPAVMFTPVRNDGTPQPGLDLDDLQKTISRKLGNAYPPLPFEHKIFRSDGGVEVLAVIIWGSAERPHFAGPAYIRFGSETKSASEVQFDALIADRSSKVRELKKWIGREITVELLRQPNVNGPRSEGRREVTLRACNEFYVSVEGALGPVMFVGGASQGLESPSGSHSFALSRVEISYDHNSDRLSLDIRW
jgi:hypothetical protein